MDKPPALTRSTYPKQWAKWWSGLQPSWRQGDGELPPAQYVSDQGVWGPLRNCGKNGLGMVLLSLVWWGRALGVCTLWTASIMDVARVMEAMVEGTREGTRKRVGEAALSSGKVKRCVLLALQFFPITNLASIHASEIQSPQLIIISILISPSLPS